MYLAMPFCDLQNRGKSPPERQSHRTQALGCQGLSGSRHLWLLLGLNPLRTVTLFGQRMVVAVGVGLVGLIFG